MKYLPAEIIKKKRNGQNLTTAEINFLVDSFSKNNLPDYQMSAFLMAVFFRGMNTEESSALTEAMLHSGKVLNFKNPNKFYVDKHSTGGVGDKTSLILAPIVAAAGVPVPMISGRGLGHTGGTLDKLESIPGFSTQVDLSRFVEIIDKNLLCFIGQTSEICPADKKMYALRDVTATVESLPLICASIMSKKLAEGIDGLVLDVKFGSGAFMKDLDSAKALADGLTDIAKNHGKKFVSILSNMDQPLGRFAGNALEIKECIEIMSGKTFLNSDGQDMYADTRELSLLLASHMLWLAAVKPKLMECRALATEILENGSALKKFKEICKIQGGNLEKLPTPKHQFQVVSRTSGYISSMNTEKIGICGIHIGAGRAISSDKIDPVAGIEFHKKISDKLIPGDIIFTVHGQNLEQLKSQEENLLSSLEIISTPVNKPKLYMEYKHS